MNPSRTHRLLRLIGLLQAGPGYNTEGLATECGVCRRTVFRDLDLLKASGLPVVFDEDENRYRLEGPTYLPPTNFTADEAMALIVLCHELGDSAGLPFLGPARAAASKLECMLPCQLREQLQSVLGVVQIQPPPNNPLDGQATVYQQLVEAVSTRRCVRILYRSVAERTELTTRLSPYRLLFSRRSWYAIGRSSLHRGIRTFNLSRIGRLELLTDTYRIPRRFSLDRHLRNAWHLIPERGPDYNVRIRFSPLVAENVAEVVWHKTQRLAFNPDGSLDYQATVSGLGEISWWILGYADQAEVLAPAELRRLVAERAARTAALYTQPTDAPHPIPAPHAQGMADSPGIATRSVSEEESPRRVGT